VDWEAYKEAGDGSDYCWSYFFDFDDLFVSEDVCLLAKKNEIE
jgi:hypothetical protein